MHWVRWLLCMAGRRRRLCLAFVGREMNRFETEALSTPLNDNIRRAFSIASFCPTKYVIIPFSIRIVSNL